MTQFTTSKGEYFICEVPKDSEHLIVDDGDLCYLPPVQKGYSVTTTQYQQLPQGSWAFLCTTDNISEEVAAGIVDEEQGEQIYFDYNRKSYVLLSGKFSFFTLLQSLLQSLNLSPDKNYAICKKN